MILSLKAQNSLHHLGKSDHVFLDIVCNFSVNVPKVKHRPKLNFPMGMTKISENHVKLLRTLHLIDPVNYSVDEVSDILKNHILEFCKLSL